MSLTKKTDHETAALNMLPEQFKNSTNLRKLIAALIGPELSSTWAVQELENVFWQLFYSLWLDTAEGQQLDGLGEHVGEGRLSPDDVEYLGALKLKVAINVSKGEGNRLIEIASVLAGAPYIHLTERYPAAVHIVAIEMTKDANLDRLQKAALAGVHVTVSGTTDDHPFIYGRARDAGGTQYGNAHPGGGRGYGIPGQADTGGFYVAIYVL